MEIKKCIEIKLIEDKFKIHWDEREATCEFGVYIYDEVTDEFHKLRVELTSCVGYDNYIEDVLDLRQELREEWKNNRINKLIDLVCKQQKYTALVKFLNTCIELELDMEVEVEYIKTKYKQQILDSIAQRIKDKVKYRKRFIPLTESYKSYSEDIKTFKDLLKLATRLLN